MKHMHGSSIWKDYMEKYEFEDARIGDIISYSVTWRGEGEIIEINPDSEFKMHQIKVQFDTDDIIWINFGFYDIKLIRRCDAYTRYNKLRGLYGDSL